MATRKRRRRTRTIDLDLIDHGSQRARPERLGHMQITRNVFYANGGFSNTRLVRVTRGNCWAYFYKVT